MQNDSFSGEANKPVSPDDWSDAKEVIPPEPEPRNCMACGKIFIPKWPKARRCEWCRKNNIPVIGEEVDNKPF